MTLAYLSIKTTTHKYRGLQQLVHARGNDVSGVINIDRIYEKLQRLECKLRNGIREEKL